MVSHVLGSRALILTYPVTGEWEFLFGTLQSYHTQAGCARFGLHPDFPRNARLKCRVDAASRTQSQTGKCVSNLRYGSARRNYMYRLTIQTYDQMGSLEREMKLRAWWLVYTADRSSACIEDHQPLLIEDMCDTVDLPAQMLVA
jgi:hypothetical protein